MVSTFPPGTRIVWTHPQRPGYEYGPRPAIALEAGIVYTDEGGAVPIDRCNFLPAPAYAPAPAGSEAPVVAIDGDTILVRWIPVAVLEIEAGTVYGILQHENGTQRQNRRRLHWWSPGHGEAARARLVAYEAEREAGYATGAEAERLRAYAAHLRDVYGTEAVAVDAYTFSVVSTAGADPGAEAVGT